MNLKPSELMFLRREKGLPYVKLSTRKRVYLEEDLMEWFRTHRSQADLSQKVTNDSLEAPETDE